MTTYLDEIVARHRREAAADTRNLDDLIERARQQPPTRGFRAAIAAAGELAVIAEVKRRSPSKGDLNPDLDPAALAREYELAGATCLSVLTDGPGFGGSPADLAAARAATTRPILRKDFTVSARDVADARLMNADCVLLIAAALDDAELADFTALASELDLDVLMEVHDERELDRAMNVNANMVGVNQRDLMTFEVDQQRAVRLASMIDADAVKVAESGVRGRADAVALRAAGYDAVLVGETLVTAHDPAAALADLIV